MTRQQQEAFSLLYDALDEISLHPDVGVEYWVYEHVRDPRLGMCNVQRRWIEANKVGGIIDALRRHIMREYPEGQSYEELVVKLNEVRKLVQ